MLRHISNKHIQELQAAIYKMLMKEVKEDQSKWKFEGAMSGGYGT